MEKVKVAMVGCGFMGQAVHLPCFLKNASCEVVALVDQNETLVKRVAGKYHIPRVYSSLDKLLESEKVDAVALIVPPQLIPALAIRAMEEGKHVFAEKPIALNLSAGQKMVKVATDKNVVLMGAYMKRYDLGSQHAKRRVDDFRRRGELGKITYARFHNFNGAWRGDLEPGTIRDEKRKEYEELGELGIPDFIKPEDEKRYFGTFINFSHDLNLMRYFLGDPQKVLFSDQRPGPSIYQSYTTSLFDYGAFKVTLETGAMECNYFDEEVVIYFEKGWIKIKYPRVLLQNVPAAVSLFNNKTGEEYPNLGYSWSFQREVDHFIDCIVNENVPLSSGADSIKDIVVAEAWYRCFKESRAVTIEL